MGNRRRTKNKASRPISRVLSGQPQGWPGSHSSRALVTKSLQRPTRIRCGPHRRIPTWPCSRRGLPSHAVLPRARCALTAPFHPYQFATGARAPATPWAVCFLLHFPWAHAPQGLPGTLSYGARTFLSRLAEARHQRLPGRLAQQPTLTDRITLPGWKFGRKTGHHPGSERLSASV